MTYGLPETVKGYPMESFTKVHQAEFEMNCNWKAYTDNFVEGYHIPGIHPSFPAVIDFSKFETVHAEALVIMTAPQKNGSIYGGRWLWGWPNFTLSVYPGGMNCSRIVPVVENRTRLVYSFFFRDVVQMTSGEGLNAYGAVTWGQMFIYQGFNERAGWMHTSSGLDNRDEFAVSPAMERMVEKGLKGNKARQGFYRKEKGPAGERTRAWAARLAS